MIVAYECHRRYPSTPLTYVVTGLKPVVEQTSDLGSRLPIIVTLINSGPSSLPYVQFVILLPLRNQSDTGEYYYLYPVDIIVSFCHKILEGKSTLVICVGKPWILVYLAFMYSAYGSRYMYNCVTCIFWCFFVMRRKWESPAMGQMRSTILPI